MNDIRGIDGYEGPAALGPQSMGRPHRSKSTPAPSGKAEQVEISEIALFMNKVAMMPQIRAQKVENVRRALAAGTYDVHGKLSLAIDRLLDEYV